MMVQKIGQRLSSMNDATTTVELIKKLDTAGMTDDVPDESLEALIENARMIAMSDGFPKVKRFTVRKCQPLTLLHVQ